MPEPLIIGDSPADWSRQRSALLPYYSGQNNINEQFRQGVLGAEEASRVRARTEDEATRRFDLERARLANQAARQTFIDRYSIGQEAQQRADTLAREAKAEKYLQDVTRPNVEAQTQMHLRYLSPAQERTQQNKELYTKQTFDDMVHQGLIESRDQVIKLVPDTTPDWADMRVRESMNRRRAIEAEAAQVEDMARTRTAFERAARERGIAEATKDPVQIAAATKNWTDLAREIARFKQEKPTLMDYVTMADQTTGTYKSAYPPLAWKQAAAAIAATPEGRKAAAVARRAALPAQQFGSLETMRSVGNPFMPDFNANRQFLALPLTRPARARYATVEDVRAAHGRGELDDEQTAEILASQFGL